jgi:hypothetical protein
MDAEFPPQPAVKTTGSATAKRNRKLEPRERAREEWTDDGRGMGLPFWLAGGLSRTNNMGLKSKRVQVSTLRMLS